MSKLELIKAYTQDALLGRGHYVPPTLQELVELLAHIERLQAQLAEAKNLYLTERTEGLFDQEQHQEWDDAEEYFDRMMALTAQQADKGE